MIKPEEKGIQRFWTERPMIHPGYGFDVESATPEEIFAHVERLFRDKGHLFQKAGEPLLSRFIDYPSLKGKRVLEIGYGSGWLLNEFVKAGANVYGIELSESVYRLSVYRFRNQPNVQLQVASAENMPFPDGYLDFVAAYGVIHHAADDQNCFDEVYRVLKPTGKAFFMLYRRGGPKYWWRKIFRKGILGGGLIRHGFNLEKFIYSVTDAYQEDSPGAPISRHYRRGELLAKLKKFSRIKLQVSGNAGEWRNLPFGRLPLSNLLGDRILWRLVEVSGAYWMVNVEK